MTYARDPYDTDRPPCLCGGQASGPVLTTAEFCPACGDPDKPVPEPPGDEIAAAVAAERERIARLAEDCEAFYRVPCAYCREHEQPFAAVIRDFPGSRECEGCGSPAPARFCSTACALGEAPEGSQS